jgi:uncharacterized protein YegJ (DUF2314 family)
MKRIAQKLWYHFTDMFAETSSGFGEQEFFGYTWLVDLTYFYCMYMGILATNSTQLSATSQGQQAAAARGATSIAMPYHVVHPC